MHGAARVVTAWGICIFTAGGARAQLTIQPTPPPAVTAENESWYLKGEPVPFAGDFYYPSGAQIHFNGNEMVRSAYYGGVPIYTRTTIEPYTLIFVPVAGGLMQPYERRPDRSMSQAGPPMAQAAAPPGFGPPVVLESTAPEPAPAYLPSDVPEAVGTAGRARAVLPSMPVRFRPQSPNGIFVEFDGARWFSSGQSVPLDTLRLTKIGESHGFPVYADRAHDGSTIYVPIARGVDVVAPYSKRAR
jgi:hypothetical protein